MFTILSFLAGTIGAVTVLQCGQLAAFYGDYSSSVITHLVGLVAAAIVFFTQRGKLPAKQRVAPWMLLGGVIGVGTVVLNNMAFGGVGVTAIIGLGLLGAAKSPFYKGKLLGLIAVLIGALVMVFPLTGANIAAVLMALATGFTIVVARTMNARYAERCGVMRSTILNYITGLTTSVIILLLLGRNEPMVADFRLSPNWFMYTAGALGVGLTVLLNITVSKVPAFAFTLLQFTGQIFTSLLLDALLQDSFSMQSAIGGALVALGMCLNTWMDHQRKLKTA